MHGAVDVRDEFVFRATDCAHDVALCLFEWSKPVHNLPWRADDWVFVPGCLPFFFCDFKPPCLPFTCFPFTLAVAAVSAGEGTLLPLPLLPFSFGFFIDAAFSTVVVNGGGAEFAIPSKWCMRFAGTAKVSSADLFAAMLGWIAVGSGRAVSSVSSTLPAGAAGIAVSAGLTLHFLRAGWMAVMALSVSSLWWEYGFSFEA